MRRSLLPILLVAFLDALSFAIVVVLMAYLAKGELGATGLVVGLLLATKQIILIGAAPLLGSLSDRFGRRPLLLVSLLGTFFSYLVLIFSGNLWMLFLSRILDGLSGGNYSIIQAIISDSTDEKGRARGMGLSGAMFGLGFVVGPVLGVLLTRDPALNGRFFDALGVTAPTPYALGFFAAALIAGLSTAAAYFLVPETKDWRRQEAAATPMPERLALARPGVRPLLVLAFAFFLPLFLYDTMFSVYLQERFDMPVAQAFRLLAILGVVQVIVQGTAIGFLVNRVGEARLMNVNFMVMGAALIGWGLTPSPALLVPIVVVFGISAGILNTVLRSALTRVVRADEAGGTLGMMAAVSGVARLVAPIMGGKLIDLHTAGPGLLAGTICMIFAGYSIALAMRGKPEASKPARPVLGSV